MDVVPLFSGFPAASDRGFLGWSSCVLLRGRAPMLFDTAGYPERAVLLGRLAEHGVDPEQVGAVFLSHFHFDHAIGTVEGLVVADRYDFVLRDPVLDREIRHGYRCHVLTGAIEDY